MLEIPEGWVLKTRKCWGGERLSRSDWSVWQVDERWAAKRELESPLYFVEFELAIEHANKAIDVAIKQRRAEDLEDLEFGGHPV